MVNGDHDTAVAGLLRELGYEAYALHQQKGFRYNWFSNETPVTWTHAIRKKRHASRGLASQLKLQAQFLVEFLQSNASPAALH